jgi:hypothetical protein
MFILRQQSIPLMWLVLLWRKRAQLNPPATSVELNLKNLQAVLDLRAADLDLQYMSFLWSDYMPNKWFYEVSFFRFAIMFSKQVVK